jgi:hypothetical protein
MKKQKGQVTLTIPIEIKVRCKSGYTKKNLVNACKDLQYSIYKSMKLTYDLYDYELIDYGDEYDGLTFVLKPIK